MSDLIYYLQAGDGPVRIDTCDEQRLRMRIGQLQAGNAEPLLLRALYQGGAAELVRLRRRHGEQHIHDRWHTAAVLDDLPELEPIGFDRDAEERKVALRRMQARSQQVSR